MLSDAKNAEKATFSDIQQYTNTFERVPRAVADYVCELEMAFP